MRQFKTLVYIVAVAAIVTLGLGGCRKEETRQIRQKTLPQVSAPTSPLPTPNTQVSPLSK